MFDTMRNFTVNVTRDKRKQCIHHAHIVCRCKYRRCAGHDAAAPAPASRCGEAGGPAAGGAPATLFSLNATLSNNPRAPFLSLPAPAHAICSPLCKFCFTRPSIMYSLSDNILCLLSPAGPPSGRGEANYTPLL